MKFPFNEPENVAVFTCKHILEDKACICYVSHDEDDGSWQFLCEAEKHSESDARIVSLKQIFDLNNSIGQLADMPLGCYAIREDADAPWRGYRK